MHALFGEIPQVLDLTLDIAERCHASITGSDQPFPKFDVPDAFTLDSYFEHRAREGFLKRREKLEALARAATCESAGGLRKRVSHAKSQ